MLGIAGFNIATALFKLASTGDDQLSLHAQGFAESLPTTTTPHVADL